MVFVIQATQAKINRVFENTIYKYKKLFYQKHF